MRQDKAIYMLGVWNINDILMQHKKHMANSWLSCWNNRLPKKKKLIETEAI